MGVKQLIILIAIIGLFGAGGYGGALMVVGNKGDHDTDTTSTKTKAKDKEKTKDKDKPKTKTKGKEKTKAKDKAKATMPQWGVLPVGQFSIPLFEDGKVMGVLLAQINIEPKDFQQSKLLSRQKPQLRSAIINSFFAMEREGLLLPDMLEPTAVSGRLKSDLKFVFNQEEMGEVLFDRLLIQESGRAAAR